MVNTWLPGASHSPMNFRRVSHWRRVWVNGVIALEGTATGRKIDAHLAPAS